MGTGSLSGFYDAFDRDAGRVRDADTQAELAALLQQRAARVTERAAA